MCSYYFLEVTLNVLDKKGNDIDVNDRQFSFYIKEALKEIFGQVGSSINFSVLKFVAGKGIIRCPSTFYVKFRGALTLFGRHHSNTVAFDVHRVSPCLIAFITNDSTYEHVSSL
ncbi:Ribonuclease P/MRP protein subunit [Cinara cedri]|uniref:Ribonuclease P/MRP protein subunit n=1 Tax=Cinara cedri TaxID=506608 RepID=A0A5E4N8Z6_9HEMI|nr:Ribonuclease P/MRP protein subunit [Cinara cedri]